jgi:hypothetical protein
LLCGFQGPPSRAGERLPISYTYIGPRWLAAVNDVAAMAKFQRQVRLGVVCFLSFPLKLAELPARQACPGLGCWRMRDHVEQTNHLSKWQGRED